jgi:paraquat-inducible protein B
MSRRANPVAIGAFVVGAAVLAIAGIVLLAGENLFVRTHRYVIYFGESVGGLRVGSSVTYQGVNVGEVATISAVYRSDRDVVDIPVIVELREDALSVEGERPRNVIPDLISHGLRAQLRPESLVTGRLLVALAMLPHTPAMLRDGGQTGLEEIPSVPSPIAGVSRSIEDLAMQTPELLAQAQRVLAHLDELLAGETGRDLARGIHAGADLMTTLADPMGALQSALADLPPTTEALRGSMANLDGLVSNVRTSFDQRQEQFGELMADLTATSAALRRAIDQANQLIARNRDGIEDFTSRGLPAFTGLIEDATRMVNEINGLARDIRQDPARFFFGDRSSEGVRLR